MPGNGNVCPQFNPELESIVEFLERFKVHCSDLLEAAGQDGKKKATILIKALPVSVITDLQRRIKPTLLSEAVYDTLTDKLKLQFQVKKSTVGAAVQFLNRKQSTTESIETYAKILNDLASACRYQDCCRDRLLRDAFISGLRSNAVITRLLQDCEDKSFNDCVEKAKFLEQLAADAQDIKPEAANKIFTKKSNSMPSTVPENYSCIRCGCKNKHLANNCPAIKLECNRCHKTGHLGKVCRSSFTKKNKVHCTNEFEEGGGEEAEHQLQHHRCGGVSQPSANTCNSTCYPTQRPTTQCSCGGVQHQLHHLTTGSNISGETNNADNFNSNFDSFLG